MRVLRLPRTNYQLYLGVIVGLICSLFLNQLFGASTTTRKIPDIPDIPESGKVGKFNFGNSFAPTIENTNGSFNNIRVLCYVLTCPKNHRTRAIHIKRTWGKRCDKLLFFSTQEDSVIDAIALPGIEEDYNWLWAKARGALKYIWEHYRDDFDWIMKADDDTYVIVENLKKFLSNYSRTDPVFFGCQFTSYQFKSWASGGAGYVFSAEAFRRLNLNGLSNPKICKAEHDGAEDVELAKCLFGVGVKLEDSRDSLGRHRLLPMSPDFHLFPEEKAQDWWYWQYLVYPQDKGINCCAYDTISYHYVTPEKMYVYEYLIYHLRPAGIDREEVYIQEYPLEYKEEVKSTSPKPTVESNRNKSAQIL